MTPSTTRKTAITLVAIAWLMIIAMACMRLLKPRAANINIDHATYPVKGIDLSVHNGIVDFDSVAADGIDFVFLKCSEGETHSDPLFVRNYAAARRNGIATGAYHFFRFDRDGRAQALNMLSAINGCLLDLPLAIDIEEWGNPAGIPTDLVTARLMAMVTHLQSNGYKVIIYTNKTGDARFVRGNFDATTQGDPELWICSFTDPPLNRRPWRLWQHSHTGSIKGIKGPVDLNTFNGNFAQWEKWLDLNRNYSL